MFEKIFHARVPQISLSILLAISLGFTACVKKKAPENKEAESDISWSANYNEKEKEIALATKRMLEKTGKKSPGDIWPDGGRSWTRNDELNFSAWIDDVPLNILDDWKIPTDCADAVLALRWIFAVQNGLAVKFKIGRESYDSTEYRSNPIRLLVAAHDNIGADSLLDLGYPVDMTIPNNYYGGMFISKGYHTFLLRGALKRNGNSTFLFRTIESTVPAKIRALKETVFMMEQPSKDYFKMLRFWPVVNRGGYLEYDEAVARAEFPPESELSMKLTSQCTNLKQYGPGIGVAPMWINFLNYAKYAHEHRAELATSEKRAKIVENCYHNTSIMANSRAFYESMRSIFEADLCKSYETRIKSVVEGYNACFGKPPTGACTPDAAGDYSTPNRDKALYDKSTSFQSFAQQLLAVKDLSSFSCGPFPLTAQASPVPPDSERARSIVLKPFSGETRSPWLVRIGMAWESSSPVSPLHVRWGCSSSQTDFSCHR
jgi:hypothetical protein